MPFKSVAVTLSHRDGCFYTLLTSRQELRTGRLNTERVSTCLVTSPYPNGEEPPVHGGTRLDMFWLKTNRL